MLQLDNASAYPKAAATFGREDIGRAAAAGQKVQIRLPRHVSADTDISKGRLVMYAPRPGLSFGGYDLKYLTDSEIRVTESPSLFCGLMLSGPVSQLDISGLGETEIRPGRPVIAHFAEATECVGFHKAGARSAGVGVRLTSDFFESGSWPTADKALRPLRALMEGRTGIRTNLGSSRLRAIADAALNGPYEGSLQALYIEGLVLAFLAELCRLDHEETAQNTHGVKQHEYRRVRKVADLLEASLEAPPSLSVLARDVGINATTLGRHFHAVYGETIFEFVRSRRLEMARSMLRDGSVPVAQVGYRVGFSSAAAFSTAYRRRYGYPPSQEVMAG